MGLFDRVRKAVGGTFNHVGRVTGIKTVVDVVRAAPGGFTAAERDRIGRDSIAFRIGALTNKVTGGDDRRPSDAIKLVSFVQPNVDDKGNFKPSGGTQIRYQLPVLNATGAKVAGDIVEGAADLAGNVLERTAGGLLGGLLKHPLVLVGGAAAAAYYFGLFA